MHDPTDPADPDNRATLPWGTTRDDPLPVWDTDARSVRRGRDIAHARAHPISDVGVSQHSLLTTEWEPNRPAAPYVRDLVNHRSARENERAGKWTVIIVGFCLTSIIVIVSLMLAMFAGRV